MPRTVTVLSSALAVAVPLLIAASPAAARPATARAAVVTVTAGKPGEYGFKLSAKSVPHGSITFKVTNAGILPHDFKLCATPATAARMPAPAR